MALLALLGYLVCSVLLAWAALWQPYLSGSLSSPLPWGPSEWVAFGCFRTTAKIQLAHSSCGLHLSGFSALPSGISNASECLNDLWTEVDNPSCFQNLFLPFAHALIDPTLNDSHVEGFITSSAFAITLVHVRWEWGLNILDGRSVV